MPSHDRPYPRQFYFNDPAIGHDVPKPYISILDRQQPEGSEILADFLANKGTAFSKAHLKLKVKGKGEDKGKGKGHKGKRNINVIMVPSKSSQWAKFSINFDPLHTSAFVKAEIEKLVGDSGMDVSFHRIPLEDMHTLDHYAIGNWSNVRLRWNAQGGHSRVDMEMAALGLSYADE